MEDIEQLSRSRAYDDPSLTRKERRQIEVEESLDNLARYMDGLFRIPGIGWRFGLDALLGLIPNVGDISTSLVSFYILYAGVRYGVPKITLLRMAMNIGIDYVVGVIPIVGDAFDFFWKSNQKNMDLIRRHGKGKGTGTRGDYLFVFLTIGLLVGILAGSVFLSVFIIWSILGGLYFLTR